MTSNTLTLTDSTGELHWYFGDTLRISCYPMPSDLAEYPGTELIQEPYDYGDHEFFVEYADPRKWDSYDSVDWTPIEDGPWDTFREAYAALDTYIHTH